MSSFFRQQLEEWVGQIDVKADRVLDVGGAQLPVKGRTKSWDVKDYKIGDVSIPHQGDRPEFILDLDDKNFDFDQPPAQRFNAVFCLEVMEYILNPIEAIKTLWFLLDKGGTLYISFAFVYPQHAPEGKDYLRYTRWGAEKLLTDAGFVDIETTVRTSQTTLMDLWRAEQMHPLKRYPGHDDLGYMIKATKL